MKINWLLSVAIICFLFATVGCSNENKWDDSNEGIQFTLDIVPSNGKIDNSNHANEISKIIAKRLDEFNIKKKKVEVKSGSTIIVQVPLYKQIDRVKKFITQQGKLEIRVVNEESKNDNSDHEALPVVASTEKLFVENDILISNKHIKNAIFRISASNNSPYILIEFTNIGAQLFSEITEKHINRRLAIIVDHYIYAAPIIREKIVSDSAMLSGDFTVEEAFDLSIILKNSSFPRKVTVRNEDIIDHHS